MKEYSEDDPEDVKKFKMLMNFLPEDSEIFIGTDKAQVDAREVDFNDLFDKVNKWGDESAKGLICGIYGCVKEPDSPCKICNCGYCSEHIKVHYHHEDHTGIILKDVKLQ